jgi:FkbM family methyltransferase
MKISFEIIETPHGYFFINAYDVIGYSIGKMKVWESHLLDFYRRVLTKDDICIDGGANLGFHSVQFGKLSKLVYAFEPQKIVFNNLCANILCNNLNENIIPFRLGLGDKKETKQLWPVENELWFGHDIINWGGRGIDQTNSIEFREEDQIEVVNLDSMDITGCSLIKLDIQGYEYFALLGSQNLLEKNKPIILLENAPMNENDSKALEFLKDLGYENYRYQSNNNEDCILIHPESNKYSISIETINLLKNQYNLKKEF